MKIFHCLLLFAAVVKADAQNSFKAVLTTPQNPGITGVAAFVLEGTTVRFTITFNLENVVPTTAQLVGTASVVPFDLGVPYVVVHSPGPWPDGYDGLTAFFGSFVLPDSLRTEFLAGQTSLQLTGSLKGDFSGAVMAAPGPVIATFSRQGSAVQMSFKAEPPYRYTVESLPSPDAAIPLTVTNVSALSQTFDVVTTAPVSRTEARFYRIRRELWERE